MDFLYCGGEEDFRNKWEYLDKNGSLKDAVKIENESCTLLQRASEKGLKWAVELLLPLLKEEKEIDKTGSHYKILPAQLAAQNGHDEVLRILMEEGAKLISPDRQSALHYVIRYRIPENKNYEKCFDMIINFKQSSGTGEPECYDFADINGYTPLHIAAQYDYTDFVLSLLEKGALNSDGVPGISCISRNTLKEFLDSRVTREKTPRDQDYKIKFDVKFLKNPSLNDQKNPDFSSKQLTTNSNIEASNGNYESNDVQNFPSEEYNSEPLRCISQIAHLKDLLTHPVLKCFINCRWIKISHTYWIELAIKSLFVIFITLYVSGFSPRALQNSSRIAVNDSLISNESQSYQTYVLDRTVKQDELTGILILILWFLSIIFYVIILFIQVFKLVISQSDIFSVDNFLEIFLIVTSGIVLFPVTDELEGNPHACAITMLLSWTVLLLFLGKHPKLSTNIEILKVVTQNFVYFLLWYSLLLIAFSFSFYILYRNSSENTLFTCIGASMFRTFVMVTGDFEVDKHPMKDVLYTSHFIFLLFVFMVVIVLMNLLNALAVDDIQSIRKESELLAIISRVNFVANTEKARKSVYRKYCPNFWFAQIWDAVKYPCFRKCTESKVKNEGFDGIISILPKEDVSIKSHPDVKCCRGRRFHCFSNRSGQIDDSIIKDAEVILNGRK